MCHLSSCALLMKNSWYEWKGERKKLSFPVERISSSREIELWHENLIFNIKYFYISLSFPNSSLFSISYSLHAPVNWGKNGRKYSPRRRNCTHKSFTWFENTWRRRWGAASSTARKSVWKELTMCCAKVRKLIAPKIRVWETERVCIK